MRSACAWFSLHGGLALGLLERVTKSRTGLRARQDNDLGCSFGVPLLAAGIAPWSGPQFQPACLAVSGLHVRSRLGVANHRPLAAMAPVQFADP